jgi:hypothetical protein
VTVTTLVPDAGWIAKEHADVTMLAGYLLKTSAIARARFCFWAAAVLVIEAVVDSPELVTVVVAEAVTLTKMVVVVTGAV